MNNYYIYLHRKETDNSVFYVGKGKNNRAWEKSKSERNQYWHRIVNKYGYSVEIVFENLTEEEAFDLEINTILEMKYLGYTLVNMTNGGDGCSGLKFTDLQRLNITNGTKGKIPWNKGKKMPKDKTYKIPESTRYKQSQAKIGKYIGETNPFADLNKYRFFRLLDGFIVTCTRSELCSKYAIDSTLLKKLFYKTKPRKSTEGWRLAKETE